MPDVFNVVIVTFSFGSWNNALLRMVNVVIVVGLCDTQRKLPGPTDALVMIALDV